MSDVRFELNKLNMKKLSAAAVKALEMTGEEFHTRVVQAQVVPRDQGTLQGVAMSVDYSHAKQGEVRLMHSTPYARRLYFHPEYHFQTKENPHARGRWFEPWMKGGQKDGDIQKVFAKFYKLNSQGVIE